MWEDYPFLNIFELMFSFNPNQLNQGDDFIINQWEWWSDDIPHDTLSYLGTQFVTFLHKNWDVYFVFWVMKHEIYEMVRHYLIFYRIFLEENCWEWWSDDIPDDTLSYLGTQFVTFLLINWDVYFMLWTMNYVKWYNAISSF